MRYGLITRRNAINTREIKGYSQIPGYNCNEKSLSGIDVFCQRFNNEEEMKTFLLDAGLINRQEWNNRVVIATYEKGYSSPRNFLEPSFKAEKPFFSLDYLLDYYQNNILDGDFLTKFRRRFQTSKDIDHRFLRLYYELMTRGTLDDYSKESLEKVMKEFIKKFIYFSSPKSKEPKINYMRLRILAKFAYKDAKEKGLTLEKETVQEKTLIDDEALKLELKFRYSELEDNPTEEQKEAILSRINDIESYFRISRSIYEHALQRRRYIKKERPELYN